MVMHGAEYRRLLWSPVRRYVAGERQQRRQRVHLLVDEQTLQT